MSIHVHKFGGSCLSGAEDIDAIVERVRTSEGRPVVVVSAFQGVTDRLMEQVDHGHEASISAFVASIEMTYLEMHPQVARSPWAVRFAETLHHLADRLEAHASSPDVAVRADALACGERLSSLTLAAALDAHGIPALPAWSEEVGIHLIGRGEDARVDAERTSQLLELPAGAVPVITGCYGVSKDGFALLGRGGSDLTATAVAAALDADRVTIWRDVEGVLTLSPRWTLPARHLSNLSYTEAAELALFSEPLLHPSAVEPLREPGIPMHLRPLHRPDVGGTIIGPSIRGPHPEVRAIGCLPHLVPFSWTLSSALSLTESVAGAMGALGQARIPIAGIRAQQGRVRLLIPERFAARAERILSERPSQPTPLVGGPISLLCFVGEGIGTHLEALALIHTQSRWPDDLGLLVIDEGQRSDAIHAEIPAGRTEEALQRMCEAFDLLTQ